LSSIAPKIFEHWGKKAGTPKSSKLIIGAIGDPKGQQASEAMDDLDLERTPLRRADGGTPSSQKGDAASRTMHEGQVLEGESDQQSAEPSPAIPLPVMNVLSSCVGPLRALADISLQVPNLYGDSRESGNPTSEVTVPSLVGKRTKSDGIIPKAFRP